MGHFQYVYLLGANDEYYKIGKATRLDRRIRQLRIQLPFPVDLIRFAVVNDATRFETLLHREFRTYRSNGEWFRFPDLARLEPLLEELDGYDLLPGWVDSRLPHLKGTGFTFERVFSADYLSNSQGVERSQS